MSSSFGAIRRILDGSASTSRWVAFRYLLAFTVLSLSGIVAISRYAKAATRNPDFVVASERVMGRQLRPVQLRRVGESAFQTVDFKARGRQLVLVFHPECGACSLARPKWEKLAGELAGAVPVHAISTHPDRGEIDTVPFFRAPEIHEWRATAADILRTVPVRIVPFTLVLSPDGEVELAEPGVPSERAVRELVRFVRESPRR